MMFFNFFVWVELVLFFLYMYLFLIVICCLYEWGYYVWVGVGLWDKMLVLVCGRVGGKEILLLVGYLDEVWY